MSLRFRRKKGKRVDYFIVPNPIVLLPIIGILVALLLPLIHWLRALFE